MYPLKTTREFKEISEKAMVSRELERWAKLDADKSVGITAAACAQALTQCGEMAGAVCIALFSLLLQGCTRPSVREPVTLTLLEEWSNKRFSEARQQELQQFTQETGIRVSLLPSPDSARQRLILWRELLATGA